MASKGVTKPHRRRHTVQTPPVPVDNAGSQRSTDTDSDSSARPYKQTSQKAVFTSRFAIVAAAFYAATDGSIRRRLKNKSPLAIVIIVPGPSWIAPVKTFFLKRFGERWNIASESKVRSTPEDKAVWNAEVASNLTGGHPVVGVAAECDVLPKALIAAADLTIHIDAPRGATIGRAIQMFTGRPNGIHIEENIALGLEFHDLAAAFRARSSAAEILRRLRNAASVNYGSPASERMPKLEDAVEYGVARTWGLTLAQDLADYRAGRISWQEVDRGAVLFSEPGLGKSLFARILAQACEVPLAPFSIADLFASSTGYLDSVLKALRGMFQHAAALAPCILFLDEIDALPNRATMSSRNRDFWTSVVTDFLLSLDNAVAGKRAGIVVIGATNNIHGVDAAVLRPGRLERVIEITRPDYAGTISILRYHLNGDLPVTDLNEIARLMVGSTGAEIMMTVRDARRAARNAGRGLQRDDLLRSVVPFEAIEPEALNRICIHEAAHAVATIMVPFGTLEYCVAARGAMSAGRTRIEVNRDDLITRASIERHAIVLLSGRAAESLLIGHAAAGSGGDDKSDLAKVTQIIAALHASAGLGDTLTYTTSFAGALQAVRTDRELRSKVEQHLQVLQGTAEQFVHIHRDVIFAVAERLKVSRHLSGEEVRRIVATNSRHGREHGVLKALHG